MPHPDHHQLRAVRQSPALSIGALAQLRADHRAMRHLFNALRRARSDGEQQALEADICALLSMHVQIRAEIFDSAWKVASLGASCLAGPGAARDDIWGLIAQLEQGAPAGAQYDDKVALLCAYVVQQCKAECAAMQVWAQSPPLDLVALGARMHARRRGLLRSLA